MATATARADAGEGEQGHTRAQFLDFLPCVALDLWKKGSITGKSGEILIRETIFTHVKNAGQGD